MKKLSFAYILMVLISAYFILSSHSHGEATIGNEGKTNAPGETYCSDCHSGGAFAPVTVSIQIFSHGTTNAISSYKPDTLYDMKVTVTKGAGSPAGYGFQMTCLTSGSNSALAGYSNLESSVTTKLLTSTGRTYIEQNATSVSNVFTFSWAAPAAGTGTVVFYASGNAVNGNDATTGDNSFYTSLSLPVTVEPLTISGVTTNVLCFGASTGAINITASGGVAPYGYNWGSGITSQNRSSIMAGNYTVTVTDNASTTAAATFNIAQPSSKLNVSGTTRNVSCYAGNNGAINITASGGVTPYHYNWGNGVTSQNRSTITAGNYSVTVTDSNSCTVSAGFIISQPSSPLSVSGTRSNVYCYGGDNGAINITAGGGTSPYTYSWGNNITSQDRDSLVAGGYLVTITDSNSCTASDSFTITQPLNKLSISGTSSNVSCFDGSNGAIHINASGGTAGYTYNWGGGISSQNRSSLTAGNYLVTVTDTNSCTASASFNISQPPVLGITDSVAPISCFGGNTTITVGATGGTSPYSGTGIFTVQSGVIPYIITDANGCTDSTSVNITQPPQLIASATNVIIPCTGGSETITVSATGGTEPYTGTGNFTVTTPGTYIYSVSDSNGCTASATGTAFSSTGLTATANISGISCNGICDGNISVAVSGGTPPYLFAWNDSVNSEGISNLCAGNYVQTVTDSTGCSIINNYAVPDVDSLKINISKDSIYCFGDSTNILANVSGGTEPYAYLWSTGQAQSNIKSAAGSYSLIITDHHNCLDSAALTITQPEQLSINANENNVSCFGNNTGAINISITGGSMPYNYNWGYGINTQNRDSLTAGNYSVIVTDNNACSDTASFIVAQPSSALSISDSTHNILCFDENTGAIYLSASGGTSPYVFNWGDGITSQNRNYLSAGNYSVIVTDYHVCSTSASYSITQPDSIHVTSSIVNDAGDSTGAIYISVSGGTYPYTFAWSDSASTQNISQLGQGTYALTVTDFNGCIKSVQNITIVATGIGNITAEKIKIYPNPASAYADIIAPPALIGNFIQVIDMDGRVLINTELTSGNYRLDVSALAAGAYFVSISANDNIINKLLIKN